MNTDAADIITTALVDPAWDAQLPGRTAFPLARRVCDAALGVVGEVERLRDLLTVTTQDRRILLEDFAEFTGLDESYPDAVADFIAERTEDETT